MFPAWVQPGRSAFYCSQEEIKILPVTIKNSGKDFVVVQHSSGRIIIVQHSTFEKCMKPSLEISASNAKVTHLDYVKWSATSRMAEHSYVKLHPNGTVTVYMSNDTVWVEMESGERCLFQIRKFVLDSKGEVLSLQGRWIYFGSDIAKLTEDQKVTEPKRVFVSLDHEQELPIACLKEHVSIVPINFYQEGIDSFYYDVCSK